MMNAELALSKSKMKELSEVLYYDDSMAKDMMKRMECQAEITNCMKNGTIQYRYTANVNLSTKMVSSFEITPTFDSALLKDLTYANVVDIIEEIGRATCRERVAAPVQIAVVCGSLKQK